ncbi:hypothetical protein GC163_12680 [bacterium]|nr:hypothetical protein [bacterium]
MKSLNQKATQVFLKLLDGLHEVGDHKKIDNTEGAFMAVHVEIIAQAPTVRGGFIVSIAHYYESHGDLVCDPDMTFLFYPAGQVTPLTFEQGGVVYQVAAKFDEGKILFNSKQQAEITSFANGWMLNIKEQQGL